jgi:simple sugar transport system permease protein
MRLGADAAGAALMGVGGACLTLAGSRIFSADMVNGRGWLCLALVICARWRLSVAFPVTLLVGAIDAYQVELRHQFVEISWFDLLPIVPYVLVILACALFARRHYPPPALLVPYRKSNRDPGS